jgi:hypothetical protein
MTFLRRPLALVLCACFLGTQAVFANSLGPSTFLTVVDRAAATPNLFARACGSAVSCDADGCEGKFDGKVKFPTCTTGSLKGCQCTIASGTCGPHKSCDENGCAGSFNGLGNVKYAKCTGNFEGKGLLL